MRTKGLDSTILSLDNGAKIKGTYSARHGGFSVVLYLTDDKGHILGHRNYAFAQNLFDAPECMKTLMGALRQLCVASKFVEIKQYRIQEVAAKALFRVLTKEAVLKSAA